jgi:hypothetical protein
MVKPGLLSLFSPIAVGVIFRIIGNAKGKPLLGA